MGAGQQWGSGETEDMGLEATLKGVGFILSTGVLQVGFMCPPTVPQGLGPVLTMRMMSG